MAVVRMLLVTAPLLLPCFPMPLNGMPCGARGIAAANAKATLVGVGLRHAATVA